MLNMGVPPIQEFQAAIPESLSNFCSRSVSPGLSGGHPAIEFHILRHARFSSLSKTKKSECSL
jgi:hypothetical protein